MTFLLTQTAFSRLRPHNQDLPLDLVDKFRLADHNLPPKNKQPPGFPPAAACPQNHQHFHKPSSGLLPLRGPLLMTYPHFVGPSG